MYVGTLLSKQSFYLRLREKTQFLEEVIFVVSADGNSKKRDQSSFIFVTRSWNKVHGDGILNFLVNFCVESIKWPDKKLHSKLAQKQEYCVSLVFRGFWHDIKRFVHEK